MIGFPLGLLAANAAEWLIHKHVLHGLGANKRSIWSFHWHEHHSKSRRNGFRDEDYERGAVGMHAQGKELAGLLGLSLGVAPIFPLAPWFCGAVWLSAYGYYHVHKKGHLDPEWARERLPWHYDHHMGPNQQTNWCVTYPLFDHIMGTRQPYAGTEREQRDLEKAAERASRRSAQD